MDKIKFLKSLAKAWFGTSQRHSIHAQLLKQRGLNKLASKIMEESDEEWDEAKKVNERLVELGVTPSVEIEVYPITDNIEEMLKFDYDMASKALPEISKSLSMFDDDYITKNMLQTFIMEEQEHSNWVKTHLCVIKQIGMENYLIEQLGD